MKRRAAFMNAATLPLSAVALLTLASCPARARDSVAVFNEVMYHPAAEDGVEWLEIASLMAVDLDLSGWRVTGGVEFVFPEGTVLPGGGYVVVSSQPVAMPGALGPFSGNLSNSGELLQLVNVSGRVMDELDYRDGGRWPCGADGSGASLARRVEGSAESGPEAWAASRETGGTPGAPNFPAGFPKGVRISEVAGTDDPVFRIELVNDGAAPVSLSGMRLGAFALPDASLAPGAFVVFDETELGFRPAEKDRLFLYGDGGATLLDAVIVRLRTQARSGERMLAPLTATFGGPNVFPPPGDVVINEIMYRAAPFSSTPETPARPNPEEWIELYNKGETAVDLSGWRLDDGVSFTFPPGVTLAAGGYLVVAKDAAALKTLWPDRADRIIGNFTGSLSNEGERIELLDASERLMDEVRYLPFVWSDGGGSSLELRDPRSDNNRPAAWSDSDETGKSVWQTYTFRANGAQRFGPSMWREFRVGMLNAGECLIDDLRVVRDPDGARVNLIQNGDFEATPAGTKWRFLGNHGASAVIEEPGNPGNHVLHVRATGPTETNHNHIETTFAGNALLSATAEYEVSFRARWLKGSNQLNTKAYYQRLAKTWELPIPPGGTPGAANSRLVANDGPLLNELTHAPAVPVANEPLTVSVEADDPDGVASVVLCHRMNGETEFSRTPMTLSGGKWTATLPGRAAGAIVHFYVEARDSAGAVAFAPSKGPDSRALAQWADNQGSDMRAHQLRLILLNEERNALLAILNRLSNERQPGTLIYRGREVYHDIGVRLQGSAASRARDGDDYVCYDIAFPPDRLFRGVHDAIGIDRSARTPAVRRQDEIYVRHTFHRAGIPCPMDDLCHFISPHRAHTGTAILQMAGYGGLWIDSQFGGKEGTVFNWDATYEPTSLSTPGNPESLKPPVPFEHTFTDFANLGDDKEQYRGPFDIRAGRRRDHYGPLMELCKTMALPTARMIAESPRVLNVDEALRCAALVNLWGIADTYYTGGVPHNIRLFVPDDGSPAWLLPWDMDFTMGNEATSPIMPTGNHLGRLISGSPANRRLYLGHVRHLCDTVFNTGYLNPWLARYGAVVKQTYGTTASYVTVRANYARRQFPAQVSYAITTNNGEPFDTTEAVAVIEGRAWIDVKEIRRAGGLEAAPVTWLDPTRWRAEIPLAPGVNSIALEALGFDGEPIATRTIEVTRGAASAQGFEAWRLRHFTAEEMANAALSGPAADPGETGMNNLLRYAFGLEPKAPSGEALPVLTVRNGTGRLEFRRRKDAGDLEYVVEVSPDLKTWTAVAGELSPVRDLGDGVETAGVDLPPGPASQFVRLRVRLNP